VPEPPPKQVAAPAPTAPPAPAPAAPRADRDARNEDVCFMGEIFSYILPEN